MANDGDYDDDRGRPAAPQPAPRPARPQPSSSQAEITARGRAPPGAQPGASLDPPLPPARPQASSPASLSSSRAAPPRASSPASSSPSRSAPMASLDPALPPARPRSRVSAGPLDPPVEPTRRGAVLVSGSLDPALPPGVGAPAPERPVRQHAPWSQTVARLVAVVLAGAGVLALVARLSASPGPDRERLSLDEERAAADAWRKEGLTRLGGERTGPVADAVQQLVRDLGRALPERLGGRALRAVVVDSTAGDLLALPDGTVVVTTGLLARLSTQAELAALAAHMVGHVALGHTAQALARSVPTLRSATLAGTGSVVDSTMTPLLRDPHEPDDEAAVDAFVALALQDSGWDVAAHPAALRPLTTMAPAWASAHGVDDARLRKLADAPSSGRSGDADYRSAVLVPLGAVAVEPPPPPRAPVVEENGNEQGRPRGPRTSARRSVERPR